MTARKKKPSGSKILKPVKPELVASVFEKMGYELTTQHGSHKVYNHPQKLLNLAIPFHNKELQPSLIKSLIRKAESNVEEFLEILRAL